MGTAVKPPLTTLQPPGTTINLNTLPQISTNQAVRYFMLAFMATVNVGFDDGAGPMWLDILDPSVELFLESITYANPMVDNLVDPITTLVNKIYGNTSLWWFFLMFNGIMHPLERTVGQILQIPSPAQVSAYGNNNSTQGQSSRGQVVTV